MRQTIYAKKRILVTFGYHLKELFAQQVATAFRKLDLDNVLVARWKGIRGLNRMAQFRRDVGAKYGVDLHDDTPKKEEIVEYYHKYPELLQNTPKYEIIAHMSFERAVKLVTPFVEKWNKQHGKECIGCGCDCYYRDQLYYGVRRPCKANVFMIEFFKVIPGITVDEAVYFLKELVEYLQSNG